MAGPTECRFAWLGTVDYVKARDLQSTVADRVHDRTTPDTLLLLEHPHVYTRGRLSESTHLLVTEQDLAAKGVSVYDTDRGGKITYHGPGQLVAYPIVNLRDWGGPLEYVRTLERTVIATLSDFGIAAHAEEGRTGVWTDSGKIAAIGIKISRGIAFHGFSINVDPDLSYYDNIVPCGIEDRSVTSIGRLLEEAVEAEAVRCNLVYQFGKELGFRMTAAADVAQLGSSTPI